ncbi:YqiA/YcfP family alpha/beta fold hydrolase [Neptunicella sp. SCSIO 80796]|uniref:YqiA/YcfP family alpha/beta fold hydrolase n=1 Tax=Neptunicella plasticusilytica TaxID=3117012 RepID=UPI003A4D8A21
MPHFILYCHGFQSSPQSAKALATRHYFNNTFPDIRFSTPQLPCYPKPAIELLENLLQPYKSWQLGFIGSSLGGYLVTYLAEKFGGRAVVVNPAVRPYELLQDMDQELVQPYTGEVFRLDSQHMQDLKAADSEVLSQPENYWALLQTGDETLDYRQAADKYQRSKLTIEQGGDHSFVGYDNHLPEIANFLINPQD